MSAVLRPLVSATGLLLVYYLLPLDKGFTGATALGLALGLTGVLLLFMRQSRSIAESSRPRLRAVEMLATVMPLFLLLFAATYYLVERKEPGNFNVHLNRTAALYFTLTVFTTVGFGDIVALSDTARILTMVQMAADLLVLGVAAKVVVGKVQAGLRRRDPGSGPPAHGGARDDGGS
ncbi:small-conductance mechanosensitive channel [Streptomyces olivoverticillatus]|uniref:Small-conductance mechanosensitive channel n=1 Tax=Streptomyces olivoverticillatus TaxID=66427 RepID=A0A7W7PKJ8_9ACTN|nr:small-conductance mechanosensitive channel [Streptomyces olivoverticillatus]